MTSSYPVHRAQRFPNQLWTEPREPRGRPVRLAWPDFQLLVDIAVDTNLTGYRDITFREGAVRFRDEKSSKLLGVAEFELFQSPGGRYSNKDYLYTLEVGEGESCGASRPTALAATLQKHFGDIANAFYAGRTVVNFYRLELVPGSRLKGRGLSLGLELMAYLQAKYKAAFFVLEPFPLQHYFIHDGRQPKPGELRDDEGYAAGKAKLTSLYETHWDAVALDEDTMLCSQVNVFDHDGDHMFFLGQLQE